VATRCFQDTDSVNSTANACEDHLSVTEKRPVPISRTISDRSIGGSVKSLPSVYATCAHQLSIILSHILRHHQSIKHHLYSLIKLNFLRTYPHSSDLESKFSATSIAFSLDEFPLQCMEQDYIVPVLFAGKTNKGYGTCQSMRVLHFLSLLSQQDRLSSFSSSSSYVLISPYLPPPCHVPISPSESA
jgi:hypothetical protein